jgi:hypothetical protein
VTHVLRASRRRPGRDRKAAAPAPPVLRDLVNSKLLVRRSAERAIEQIEGKSK